MISAEKRALLNKFSSDEVSFKQSLGSELHKCKNVVKAKYSFAVQGGAVGDITLVDDDGLPVVIPSGCIVVNSLVDIVSALSSTGGTGTIALKVQSAGDVLAAVDADTLSAQSAGIPISAATAIKLTADRTVKMTVAVNALLGGKLNLFLEYVQSE